MYAQEYWIKIRPLHGPILTIRLHQKKKKSLQYVKRDEANQTFFLG